MARTPRGGGTAYSLLDPATGNSTILDKPSGIHQSLLDIAGSQFNSRVMSLARIAHEVLCA